MKGMSNRQKLMVKPRQRRQEFAIKKKELERLHVRERKFLRNPKQK